MTQLQLKVYDHSSNGVTDLRGITTTNNGSVYAQQYISYPFGEYEQWCACVGWRTRFAKHRKTNTCRHWDNFLSTIENTINGVNINMSKLVKTNIGAFNKVFGGIPLGIGMNLYGLPKSAKTTSAVWMGLGRMQETNKDLLVLDVEKGLADHMLPNKLRVFNKDNGTDIGIIHKKIDFRKWKRSPSSKFYYKDREVDEEFRNKEQNVVVVDVANIKEMTALVGMPYNITYGRKISLQPYNFDLFSNGDIWDSPIGQLVDDPNSEQEYCGYVFDSLTHLMKVFGIEQQSFPPRDTAQSIVINQMGELLHEYDDMFGITITHGSRPPADSSAISIPVGGKAIGHGFKYSGRMTIDNAKTTNLSTTVLLEPYRLPSGSLVAGQNIVINDKGVF